jgi:hypothetical protein
MCDAVRMAVFLRLCMFVYSCGVAVICLGVFVYVFAFYLFHVVLVCQIIQKEVFVNLHSCMSVCVRARACNWLLFRVIDDKKYVGNPLFEYFKSV